MSAAEFEAAHVHSVYDAIAPHFSSTRYKPWPLIAEFLQGVPAGQLGADVGCGNGKYLGVQSALGPPCLLPHLMLGVDRSFNLLQIAKERGHEVVQADCLALPFRHNLFDFSISIATIHHLTTLDRRKQAVKEMLLGTHPGAELVIQVWAQEQKDESSLARRKGPSLVSPAPLPTNASAEQDVFVPWKLQSDASQAPFQRFYHLFKEGELDDLVRSAASELGMGIDVVQTGWERGNWFVVLRRHRDS